MYVDIVFEFKDIPASLKTIGIITGEICYDSDRIKRLGYLADFLAEFIRRGKNESYALVQKIARLSDSTGKPLIWN